MPPPSMGALIPPGMNPVMHPRAAATYRPPKIPGPCFQCLKMGHLKVHCPDLAKPYPFDVNNGDNACLSSDCVSLNNQCITSGLNYIKAYHRMLPQRSPSLLGNV